LFIFLTDILITIYDIDNKGIGQEKQETQASIYSNLTHQHIL